MYTRAPSIGGVFVIPIPHADQQTDLTSRKVSSNRFPLVFPCTVDARWVPVSLWIDPNTDSSIHDNLSDLVKVSFDIQRSILAGTQPITIQQDWADALNILTEEGYQTIIEALIAKRNHGIALASEISFMLGLHITGGLARVRSEVPMLEWPHFFQGPTFTNDSISVCRASLWLWAPPEVFSSQTGWMETNFDVVRYGYGWGLDGVPIKLASSILLLHTLMCLMHVISIMFAGRTPSLVKTISEGLALAMNSRPTEKLANTCAGIEALKTWKVVTTQEVSDGHSEFLFVDGSDEEDVGEKPVLEKRYGNPSGLKRRRQKALEKE